MRGCRDVRQDTVDRSVPSDGDATAPTAHRDWTARAASDDALKPARVFDLRIAGASAEPLPTQVTGSPGASIRRPRSHGSIFVSVGSSTSSLPSESFMALGRQWTMPDDDPSKSMPNAYKSGTLLRQLMSHGQSRPRLFKFMRCIIDSRVASRNIRWLCQPD